MDNLVLEERLLGSEAEEQPNLKRRIWVESKLIWRIAFPSILARVTSFGMVVVTQLFIGHVSALDLASYICTCTERSCTICQWDTGN